jgi:hypothetical protein
MPDENHVGLRAYQSGLEGKSAPRAVFIKLLEKTRLRAALAAVQSEIDAAIPTLSHGELQELQVMMATEIAAADIDAESLRAQIAEEAALAQTTKAMSITIARRASVVLGMEAERRVQRGVFASAESLVGEAVQRANFISSRAVQYN